MGLRKRMEPRKLISTALHKRNLFYYDLVFIFSEHLGKISSSKIGFEPLMESDSFTRCALTSSHKLVLPP